MLLQNYDAPKVEILEMEVETAILQVSGESYSIDDISDGGDF